MLRISFLNKLFLNSSQMWVKVFDKWEEGEWKSLLVCLSTAAPQYRELYSQARELSNYLLKKMKFEEQTIIYSSSLGPEVIVENGMARLPYCAFYSYSNPNFLLLSGDTSPIDEQFEFSEFLLSYVSKLGVKEVYSVGARWTDPPLQPDSEPELKGFSTDEEGNKILRENGVKIITNEVAPFFASIIVGMAKDYGMRGYKISVDHGEPRPHLRSVAKMLNLLKSLIGFEVDMEELNDKIRRMSETASKGTSVYR